jgi:hypothetical protein
VGSGVALGALGEGARLTAGGAVPQPSRAKLRTTRVARRIKIGINASSS